MAMARFGQVITAMVTPFDDDGRLDVAAAAEVARWLVAHGSEGLVLAGTTGESPTLRTEETFALAEAVRAAVDVPLILGTGSNDTAHGVELTAKAASLGMDAALVVTPYYNRPSQEGLYRHFTTLARATDLPVIIYDIPTRTGRKVDTDTLLRLARDVDNIVAVKDAAGDVVESARLMASAPEGFELYSGEDSLTLPLLSIGACGVISVASHWTGPLWARMISSYLDGDVAGARAANCELMAHIAFETGLAAPNPVPSKAMMRVLGLPVGECRPPMGPTPAGLEDEARRLAASLDLL